ncbi:MAG TPA: hypothetical protein VH796_00825 [Nitrososphaeraceae archaeon]|jgi:hypothetical protein
MSSIEEPEQNVTDNLQFIEEEIEASSQYFKPKPDRTYVIKMDRSDKIVPVESDRFHDANGKPIKRYECTIIHVNSARRQIWSVSKTVCLQIIAQLKEGFTVLKITRRGSDRNTTYEIEGVQ